MKKKKEKKRKKNQKNDSSVYTVAFLYMANIYIRKGRNTDTMYSKHGYNVFETQTRARVGTHTSSLAF